MLFASFLRAFLKPFNKDESDRLPDLGLGRFRAVHKEAQGSPEEPPGNAESRGGVQDSGLDPELKTHRLTG